MSIKITCEEKITKKTYELEVLPTATVQEVRTELAPLIKRKLAGILLFSDDEYLQNEFRLDQYGICDGAHLTFEARLCGVLPANHDWSKSGLKTKRFAF
jgi:hypothetical protein